MKNIWMLFCIGLMLFLANVCHSIENLPFTIIGKATPPVIDGVLSDTCWQQANSLGPFVDNVKGRLVDVQTKGYISYDDSFLYIAFSCKEPQVKGMRTKQNKHDSPVWTDNCVEIFIEPAGSKVFYHLAINSAGVCWDAKATAEAGLLSGTVVRNDASWESKANLKTKIMENSWAVELAIPFSTLGSYPETGERWRLNLCRERRLNSGEINYSCWSTTKGGFNNPERFGKISFGELPVNVSELTLYSAKFGENRFKLILNNKSSAKKKVLLRSSVNSVTKSKSYTILKDSQEITGNYWLKSSGASDVGIALSIGGEPFFSTLFASTPVDPLLLETDQAYYYLKEKRLKLKLLSGISPTQLSGYSATLTLLNYNSKPIMNKDVKILSGTMNQELDISSLPEGKYYIKAQLLEKGKQVFSTRVIFRRIEKGPGRKKIDVKTVSIDDNLNLLVNGEPFFPLYGYHVTDGKSLKEYAELPFNSSAQGSGGGDIDRMNRLKEYNILTWMAIWRGLVFPEINKQLIKETILRSRNHPGVLWWAMGDELEHAGMRVKKNKELYEYMKKLAPNRPVMQNFCDSAIWANYADATDIFSFDWYPIPQRPVVSVASFMESARKAVDYKKPVFYVVQNWHYRGKRVPRPEEQRCMAYLAIVHEAKGLGFYSICDPCDPNWYAPKDGSLLWSNLKGLLTEINRLAPVIAKKTVFEKNNICDNSTIHTMIKKINEREYYLFTVNSSEKPAKTVFRLPINGIKNIEEVFIHHTISPESFSECYDPFEVKIYRIDCRS